MVLDQMPEIIYILNEFEQMKKSLFGALGIISTEFK